jgi:hypothetical protein
MLISKPLRKFKSCRQKKFRNSELALFSITNLLKFSVNNFFPVHLFPIISTDLKSEKNAKNEKFFGVVEYKENMF